MMDLEELQRLKAVVDKHRREADKAAGALEGLKTRLLEEFGCQTLKGAKELLFRLEKECQREQEAFDVALREFEAKWGGKLEE